MLPDTKWLPTRSQRLRRAESSREHRNDARSSLFPALPPAAPAAELCHCAVCIFRTIKLFRQLVRFIGQYNTFSRIREFRARGLPAALRRGRPTINRTILAADTLLRHRMKLTSSECNISVLDTLDIAIVIKYGVGQPG